MYNVIFEKCEEFETLENLRLGGEMRLDFLAFVQCTVLICNVTTPKSLRPLKAQSLLSLIFIPYFSSFNFQTQSFLFKQDRRSDNTSIWDGVVYSSFAWLFLFIHDFISHRHTIKIMSFLRVVVCNLRFIIALRSHFFQETYAMLLYIKLLFLCVKI